jgi:hypothetical protein
MVQQLAKTDLLVLEDSGLATIALSQRNDMLAIMGTVMACART